MNPTLLNQLKKNLSIVFSSNVILAIINMVTMIYFMRIIGAGEVGKYATIIVGIELSLSVVRFGFNQYIILHPNDQVLFNTTFIAITIQSIISVVIVSLLLAVLYFLGNEIQSFLVPGSFLILAQILGYYTTFFYARLEAKMEYDKIVQFRLYSRFLGIFSGFIMLFWYKDLTVLVIRDFLTSVLFFLLILNLVKPKIQIQFSKKSFQKIWNFSFKFLGLNILERVAQRIDYAIVRILLSEVDLGIYYAIRGIMEGILGFIVFPIQTVIYSYYTKLDNKIQLFQKINSYNWLLLVVVVIGLLLTKVDFSFLIDILFGEEFISGNYLLAGLFIYFFSIIWFENFKVFSIAIEIQSATIISRVIQVITSLIFVTLFTWLYGFTGAGLASGLSAMVLVFSSSFFLKRKMVKEKM